MAVTDIPTMKVIATPAIGSGPGRRGLRSRARAWPSAPTADGTLTIVKAGERQVRAVDTVTTERGARTMARGPQDCTRVYLLAAEYGPTPPAKDGKKGRRRCCRTVSTYWWLGNKE